MDLRQLPHLELPQELLHAIHQEETPNSETPRPAIDLYVGDHKPLSKVSNFKYLGLNISQDLSWSHHIESVCKKARKLIGMLYRKFYKSCNSHTLHTLFKSMILPHMEYACVVWDPHLVKDTSAIEKVHKFAL